MIGNEHILAGSGNKSGNINRPIRVAVFVIDVFLCFVISYSIGFFMFCYILLDWLFDFFPSSTKRYGKIHRQFFVE